LIKTKFPIKRYKIYKLGNITIKDFVTTKTRIDFCISPVKFIERIANADLVISASFHCIAMSLILNVPFVAILTGDQGKDERLLNLLRITGLESRILNEKISLNEINRPTNFLQAEAKLKKYRNRSKDFLKKAIFT